MNKKSTKLFVSIITSIFIITISVYVISLVIEYNANKKSSEDSFSFITRTVTDALQYNTSSSDSFQNAILSCTTTHTNIRSIQLMSSDSVLFSYPKDTQHLSKGSSAFIRSSSTTIIPSTGNNLTLTTSLYLLKPLTVYTNGKYAFIIILIATLSSIIYLMIISAKQKDESDDVDSELSVSEYIPPANNHSVNSEMDKDFDNIDKNIPVKSELCDEQEQKQPATSTPQISSITGFSLESGLVDVLDAELQQAASNEQDLSLFMIRIPCIDWKSEHVSEICSLIMETFKPNDLVFEYKQDGCAAIMRDFTIEQALSVADTLHIQITALLAKYGFDPLLGIGISTRSFRLISGKRLFTEAEQALLHALEDKSSPVVAFRVNPEKYRQYLAEENKPLDSEDNKD